MQASVRETHFREIYTVINRHELAAMLASRVADIDGVKIGDPGVTFKVTFRDATEGSPSYKVGTEAVVVVTVSLPGNGATE